MDLAIIPLSSLLHNLQIMELFWRRKDHKLYPSEIFNNKNLCISRSLNEVMECAMSQRRACCTSTFFPDVFGQVKRHQTRRFGGEATTKWYPFNSRTQPISQPLIGVTSVQGKNEEHVAHLCYSLICVALDLVSPGVICLGGCCLAGA